MIVLYCRTDCPQGTELREALEELAIDARTVVLAEGEALPRQLPAGARPPLMTDEGRTYEGCRAILEHLEELRLFKEDWYRFQSDACYCNEEVAAALPTESRAD